MPARHDRRPADDGTLDLLLQEILVDAYGDGEQLTAFHQAFEEHVALPADAFVIGEPISVIAFDFDGNERRGLTATCRREGAGDFVLGLCDVRFPPASPGARYVAAFRHWLGLEPVPDSGAPASPPARRHRAAEDDLDLGRPVELIVLAVKKTSARCRIPGTGREITLRARVWELVPGEIVTVQPRKRWSYAGHPYLSGDVAAIRLDGPTLGLTPLRLTLAGTWDPSEEYWGEKGESLEPCFQPIVDHGPRPQFEMEQILPGEDPEDPFSDPILEAAEMNDFDPEGARELLMEVTRADLRCLDAHAHLGNRAFDVLPEDAIRHYAVGVCIGELSLGADFDGLLPWGCIDNRPFLRCLHGYGLCLWRLGRLDEAAAVFDRLLWLNPTDNQGVRFLVGPVREGVGWEEGTDGS